MKLSIVERDCVGWTIVATKEIGFGAYWHHRQSLDRLGMPRVCTGQQFLALLLPHSGISTGVLSTGGNVSVLQMTFILRFGSSGYVQISERIE